MRCKKTTKSNYHQGPVEPSPGGCTTDCHTGTCVIACAKQRYAPGQRTLRMSAKTIQVMREALSNPEEVGVLMEPNFETGEINVIKTTGGDKDSVEIPVGVLQGHSHPNSCKSKDECYFDFPSENDLSLIASDSMKGVVAHYVFSVERVYRVALSPQLRLKFARDPHAVGSVFDHFETVMNRLQDRASSEGIGVMPSLLKDWLEEARKYGFDVKIFNSPEDVVEHMAAI